jgi:hypothetical protein
MLKYVNILKKQLQINNLDATASTMLKHSSLKFTDMPQFITQLYVDKHLMLALSIPMDQLPVVCTNVSCVGRSSILHLPTILHITCKFIMCTCWCI